MPVVGGHTNARTDRGQLAVAILGRAKRLLTSFDARPGDRLVAAIDLRGRYREPFSNWEAATAAPPARLRADLEVLPSIAEAGLGGCRQGHFPGRHRRHGDDAGGMLPRRRHDRCRRACPSPTACRSSAGCRPSQATAICLRFSPRMSSAVLARFGERGIAAAEIGAITADHRVLIRDGAAAETIWDFAREPLIGCTPAQVLPERLRMSVRMRPAMRIAILAHSTNPRGGVVHGARARRRALPARSRGRGSAPDATGAGFFRDTLCRTSCVPATPAGRDVTRHGRDPHRRLCPSFRTPAKPMLRHLARAGRDFGQCLGDPQGARPDPRLCPHRASCRYVRR